MYTCVCESGVSTHVDDGLLLVCADIWCDCDVIEVMWYEDLVRLCHLVLFLKSYVRRIMWSNVWCGSHMCDVWFNRYWYWSHMLCRSCEVMCDPYHIRVMCDWSHMLWGSCEGMCPVNHICVMCDWSHMEWGSCAVMCYVALSLTSYVMRIMWGHVSCGSHMCHVWMKSYVMVLLVKSYVMRIMGGNVSCGTCMSISTYV